MPAFFTSVEFYVLCFVVAVAIAAVVGRPLREGEATTSFARAEVLPDMPIESEGVVIKALDDGTVDIIHHGVPYAEGCEVAVAVNIIGSDIRLTERVTPLPPHDARRVRVRYNVSGLRAMRYHLYFDSTATGQYAAGSLLNEPGFSAHYNFVG